MVFGNDIFEIPPQNYAIRQNDDILILFFFIDYSNR